MPNQKMNPDEIDIGTPVVGRLIAEQFPHWARPADSRGVLRWHR